ncbi:hypothetical protein Q9L58_002376 [Maublancomyces gigas]|uniref:Uncharacterized protein n=1 Tax=Discina gigas TaxID=1032678 RepID=A0ABR3GRT9_9PEZI
MLQVKAPTIADALRAYESMTPEEQSRRYRGLLKSHKQLEARVREGERAAQWWKDRTCTLDDRSRELAALLKAALDEKKALTEMVDILETEMEAMGAAEEGWALERRRGREKKGKGKKDSRRAEGVGAVTQTDAQDEKIVPVKGTMSECESVDALEVHGGVVAEKEDPLGAMLSRRKERQEGRSRSGSLGERGNTPMGDDRISLALTTKSAPNTNGTNTNSRGESRASGTSTGTAFQIEAPPHPEVFSKARKERKQALKMKVKATREMVNGLRRENGLLEGLLAEELGK